MAWAALTDVTQWYNTDHIPTLDADIASLIDSAENVVRAYVAGRLPGSVIASWTTPTNTPDLIREATGKLVAAWRIRGVLSSVTGVPDIVQSLYDEAMAILRGINDGTLDVDDLLPPGTVLTAQDAYTEADFSPSGADLPAPVFTMAQDFS